MIPSSAMVSTNPLPSLSSVKEMYEGIFSYKISFTKTLEINPLEAIIGVNFIFLACVHAKMFIDSFRAKKVKVMNSLVLVDQKWDKKRIRVISAVNLVGAVSRFFDWGIDRGWFILKTVNAVSLKVLGSITGVINYAHASLRALEQMKEVERLGEMAATYRVCQKEEFDCKWYSCFSNFLANFTFMTYSGVQLVNVSVGVIVASEMAGILLLIGIVMFSVSYFFHAWDYSAPLLDRMRFLDPRAGAPENPVYSFVAR